MPLFLGNTYLFECLAQVIAQEADEKGMYLVLDRTVFYPQGGGQPTDVGTIECNNRVSKVTNVRKDNGEIKHYLAEPCADYFKDMNCLCVLDKDRRILNARYHTAGHLFSTIVENLCPELVAIKAHCFPGEAYVEFHGENACDREALRSNMETAIASDLPISTFEMSGREFEQKFYKLPYPMPAHDQFRAVQISGYKPIPCGGTHLASTKEIVSCEIGKIKNKNGNLRISFTVI